MPTLAFTSYVITADAADYSHITDLALQVIGGQTILLATTRYDGVISSWDISDNAVDRIDSADHAGTLSAGVSGSIQSLTIDGTPTLLTGGYAGGGLGLYGLSSNGHIDNGTALAGTTGVIGQLQHGITIQLGTGNQAVYGGVLQQAGVGQALFDADGGLISTRVFRDTTDTFANQITALATADVAGQTYLFSASAIENGVTSWTVPKNGVLTQADSMGVDDGLWIAGPSALATADMLGKTYLLVGSATSNSISIMEIGPDGEMIIRDHMLDTRDTRFAGITTIEVATHKGQTYVIAGGSDDGISIFQLIPGGQLVHRETRADATNMGIANISDIVAHSTPNGLEIFVSSSSEAGITALRFDGGATGNLLQTTHAGGVTTGTNGADVLRGMGGDDTLRAGAGDDILVDGTGDDVLTGGAGADTFVLSFDGSYDIITDFTLGEDTLDLSGWPMLRSKAQLTMSMTNDGMKIIYGDETLIIKSADGKPIDHRQLDDSDLIGGTRVPQIILPGYAGPYTPDPDLPGRFVAPEKATETSDLFGYQGQNIQGQFFYNQRKESANGATYFGGKGFDTKHTGKGNDRLYGGAGKDTLYGDKGVDRLYGGEWNDRLLGGQGDDILYGNRGSDKILGGDGRDKAYGGSGDDIIYGNQSDDVLYGNQNKDKIYGGQSNDRIFGGDGNDKMLGDTGHDMLDGGQGHDVGTGGQGRDVLYGRDGKDKLSGNEGTDQIYGNDGNDSLYGGDDYDVISGGADNDKIWGGKGKDKLKGDNGNDRIDGGKDNDGIWGGKGNDHLIGSDGKDVIKGGKGQDKIFGGNGQDVLYGDNDADTIDGGKDADHIFGGNGNDMLSGSKGNDVINAGDGRDTVNGGINHDTIFGEDSNDTLFGRDGHDTLFGGAGDDMLYGEYNNDHLFGDNGDDRIMGGKGYDVLGGGKGDDFLNGEGGDDTVSGGKGNDVIYGKNGNDTLAGGMDQDDIYGGDGDDILSGDHGDDTLWGGIGNDTFHFTDGNDLVADFDQAQDQIALDYHLWDGTLAVSDVVILFGNITDTTVTLDFDNGHVLTITGVTDYDSFADSIAIV